MLRGKTAKRHPCYVYRSEQEKGGLGMSLNRVRLSLT